MASPIVSTLAALALASAPSVETRCGWLVNPTPANWWLTDADGTWIIGVQGGYQAEGFGETPWEGTSEQVKTNGNYGYECACMRVISAPETMQITRVLSVRSLPLSRCKEDPNLPDAPS